MMKLSKERSIVERTNDVVIQMLCRFLGEMHRGSEGRRAAGNAREDAHENKSAAIAPMNPKNGATGSPPPDAASARVTEHDRTRTRTKKTLLVALAVAPTRDIARARAKPRKRVASLEGFLQEARARFRRRARREVSPRRVARAGQRQPRIRPEIFF
jgi:hypothetical protein